MDNMEFWGIEVKGKESNNVKVEEGHLLHLSQATLGELKKDGEQVTLYVKVDEKKLVLGFLNPKTNPQLSFDLVFERDFEISHNWKNGSVHLLGYQSELPEQGEEFSDFSDEDEAADLPVSQKENGKASAKVSAPKAITVKSNDKKLKPVAKDDSDDDEDSDDDSDEGLVDMSDDSDENDEDSSDEEETPAKPESAKKRKPEVKTPEPKKAKLNATPQKTDGKKGAPHTATPHPAKKGGKASPVGEKSAPKSGAPLTCGPCKKTFNSEVGLESHKKAKHSGGK